jgi:hypothetical protein
VSESPCRRRDQQQRKPKARQQANDVHCHPSRRPSG